MARAVWGKVNNLRIIYEKIDVFILSFLDRWGNVSTFIHANEIMVRDENKKTELGTHQSLLNQSGLYWKLWQEQYGGK